jgi:hypothetical protein
MAVVREVTLVTTLEQATGQTDRSSYTEVNPLKRVLAIAALLVGATAAFAIPASAETACLTVHVQVNDQVVDQAPCV